MPGFLTIAVLVVVFVVWWLVFKVKAGARGVEAHRELLVRDSYYQHLQNMAAQETAIGETRGHFQERAQVHLLDHLRDTQKLTEDEHAQAVRRVQQQFSG